MSKTAVSIVGATGSTGKSIADALLVRISSVRPASLQKPVVENLSSRGAEIRPVDFAIATPEQLAELLRGVDIVVSTMEFDKLELQYVLIDAAKKAGVKRFVPSDRSPICMKGVRRMHDQKLAIHEYIIKSDLRYTFIDAGYWFALPPIDVDAIIHLADFAASLLASSSTSVRSTSTSSCTLKKSRETRCRVTGKHIPDPLPVTEDEVKELVKKTDPTKLGTGGVRQGSEFEFTMWEYAVRIMSSRKRNMEASCMQRRCTVRRYPKKA